MLWLLLLVVIELIHLIAARRFSHQIPNVNVASAAGGEDVASSARLTASMCAAHPNNLTLYEIAYASMKNPDMDILYSKFDRVSDGYMVVIVDEDDGEDSGGGTNTDGSYATFSLYANESLADGVCEDIPNSNGGLMCDPEGGTTVDFNLGHVDAIAFIACTPPPVRYYSYDLYITARLTEEYPFYPGCNFGDTISNLVVNTSSPSGSKFSEPVLVIHAADADAAEVVKEAYVSSGRIAADAVSIRYFPVDTVRMWDRSQGTSYQDSAPDVFSFVHRISVPLEGFEEEYAAYKHELWPVRMFFAADTARATSPTQPPLKERYSAAVADEVATLSAPLQRLSANIIQAFTGKGATTSRSSTSSSSSSSSSSNEDFPPSLRGGGGTGAAVYVGTDVLNLTMRGFYDDWEDILAAKNNDSFIFPDRDAIYGVPPDADTELHADTAGVLVGVVHSRVQNATYSSVGLDVRRGIYQYLETHWFIDTDLMGSAARYYGGDGAGEEEEEEEEEEDASQFLFAIDFLPPGGCVGSAYPQWCVEFNRSSVSTGTRTTTPSTSTTTSASSASITNALQEGHQHHPHHLLPANLIAGERVYGVRDTTIGPSANVTIPSRFIVFSEYHVVQV